MTIIKEMNDPTLDVGDTVRMQYPPRYNFGWISIEDKLPIIGTSVLIFVPSYNEIHTAELCSWDTCDDWHISFGKHTNEVLIFEKKEVTHWQSLPPEPPNAA
jgi:hypothetical protein